MKKIVLLTIALLMLTSSAGAADRDVTGLSEATSVTGDDLLMVVDDPAGAKSHKKITITNLFGSSSTFTIDISLLPIAAPGADGAVLCSSGGTWARCTTATLDDGAAQIVHSDATGNKILISAASITGNNTRTLTMADGDVTLQAGTVVSEGVATGGIVLGDASPDADGEIGYASNAFVWYANSEDMKITASANLWTFDSNTSATFAFTPKVALNGGASVGDDLTLHSSDEDPAATAGNLKHDSSDTAASGGGDLKWNDGTNVRTLIDVGTTYTKVTKYEYLPIRYAEDDDTVTAPAAAAEIGTTSLIARSFAEDADNGVVFFWQIPGDYVSGIKFRVFFATDTNASANETAVFNLSGCAFGSSGAIACTEGTGQEAVLELTTDEDTGELLVTGWSAAITVDGTPAAGKIAKLLLIRDVTGGSTEDDMAGHALVAGIEIKYVGKINPFSDY